MLHIPYVNVGAPQIPPMVKYTLFDQSEFKERHKVVLDKLSSIDFSVIFNRSDLFYYSGTGQDGIIILDHDGLRRYVRRNIDLAKEESVLDTQLMESFRLFKELETNGLDTLGLELDILPYRTVKYIADAFGSPKIIDIGEELRRIRSTKSTREQQYMRSAARQTDLSFEYIQEKIQPGKSELQISADIEHFLRREGHPGFVNVRMFHHNLTSLAYVMTGKSTATLNSLFGPVSGQGLCRLHKNGPSHRKIKDGSAVLIDTTGVVEGYTADETRTFFVGSIPQILKDAYDVAKEIQHKTKQILLPGKEPKEVDHELQALVNEYGMEENFMGLPQDKVPFIGHGIGLELDEYPIITDKFEGVLEPGNIVAMEPKLIFDEPQTGIGLEDSWIVKNGQPEKITHFPW